MKFNNKKPDMEALVASLGNEVFRLKIEVARHERIILLMERHRDMPLATGVHMVNVDGMPCEVNFGECELIYSFEYLEDKLEYCTKIMGKHPEIVKIEKLCVGYYKTPGGKFVVVKTGVEADSKVDVKVVTEDVVRANYFKDVWGRRFIEDNAHYKRDVL